MNIIFNFFFIRLYPFLLVSFCRLYCRDIVSSFLSFCFILCRWTHCVWIALQKQSYLFEWCEKSEEKVENQLVKIYFSLSGALCGWWCCIVIYTRDMRCVHGRWQSICANSDRAHPNASIWCFARVKRTTIINWHNETIIGIRWKPRRPATATTTITATAAAAAVVAVMVLAKCELEEDILMDDNSIVCWTIITNFLVAQTHTHSHSQRMREKVKSRNWNGNVTNERMNDVKTNKRHPI